MADGTTFKPPYKHDAGTELRRALAPTIHSMQVSENNARRMRGAAPLPFSGDPARDRELWIVTLEDGVRQVRFCDQTKLYTGEEVWSRTDGESGSWEASDIIGWADDYEAVRMFDEPVTVDPMERAA